jgi:hypothetical protein
MIRNYLRFGGLAQTGLSGSPELQPGQPAPVLDAGNGVSPAVLPANLRIFSASSGVGRS